MVRDIETQLQELADPKTAADLKRFFKTGQGQYSEHDRFLGIRVPVLRTLLNRYPQATADDAAQLLDSPYHEQRMLALLLLVKIYQQADAPLQQRVFELYSNNLPHINNWDLVDSSAAQIVGRHLEGSDKRLLHQLAESPVLWERRIAIVATWHDIKQRRYDTTLRISASLLNDPEDLIHKAVGWMLREIGNRDRSTEECFLRRHYRTMPRTMLRYAIEKFPASLRQDYLQGKI